MPDVRKPRRGKQRIHHRMAQNVAVAVGDQPAFRRYFFAAENDVIFFRAESVRVDADACARFIHGKILRKGQFFVARLAREQAGWCDVLCIHARIVGKSIVRRDSAVSA